MTLSRSLEQNKEDIKGMFVYISNFIIICEFISYYEIQSSSPTKILRLYNFMKEIENGKIFISISHIDQIILIIKC